MENNPYAAPGAVVADTRAFDDNNLEARKATRISRFGAKFLDGLIIGFASVPLTFYMLERTNSDRKLPFQISPTVLAVSLVGLLIVAIINAMLINRNGQTIGKKAVGIKTVRKDGSAVTVPRVFFLRYLPITLLNMIPMIGSLIALVDACMIFGSEKRCLHDLFADTIVIED
jgi:uncharacterized RDD family membrane protein YckC